ncbi:PEP-CTERM sorting domain-containing protein [Pseudorhodoferax sp.]|jgi:hypothetical protein|uniref:PEP-CTERM sorting domain-containing protein n=1 Tax=Pseudorhodoferax sp. TaxID=1993553 RepID=UPI002DD64A53|nr:PEP-CTERM sorting domain-containing protein [Pseudorhodoferax sp.]
MHRWISRLLLLAALWVPAAFAQTFIFTGAGALSETSPPDAMGDWGLQANGAAYSFEGYAGSWTLLANFVYNVNSNLGSGSFSFSQGADSLTGTLSSSGSVIAQGAGFDIVYTVTGGTGVFAGLTGGGNSVARLLGNPNDPPPVSFFEAGIMNLQAIPEPQTGLLLAAGLGFLAWRRLRRI